MTTLPLLLTSVWILCWLGCSYEIIRFIKRCPSQDDPGFLLWDLEDQLPLLVAVLLVMWPVVAIQVTMIVLKSRTR